MPTATSRWFLAFSVFCLANSAHSAPPPGAELVEFDRIDGSTIHFRNSKGEAPKPVRLVATDLKFVGQLRPAEPGYPYFLLEGKTCANCAEPTATLFLVRPSDKKATELVYPGRILEPKTRAVLMESRAFYGRCLYRQKGDVYVAFQRERVDRRRALQASVFIAQPGNDILEERLLERGLPRLQETLKLVKAKSCREIDGKHRLMLSKPLDLTPRHDTDDAEDDDTPTKENQTDTELAPAQPTS